MIMKSPIPSVIWAVTAVTAFIWDQSPVRAEDNTLSNAGHYLVGPYEFFAEDPAYLLNSEAKAQPIRSRIFIMPVLSLIKSESVVFQNGKVITAAQLDQLPPSPANPKPSPAPSPSSAGAVPTPPANRYDARLVFRLTTAQIDFLSKIIIAGQLENWPLPKTSQIVSSQFDEEGTTVTPEDNDQKSPSDFIRSINFDESGAIGQQLRQYRFEINAPQSVEVSVYCLGGKYPGETLIGRSSLGANAYLGTSSTIAVDCSDISQDQAKMISQGYFSAVAVMRVALSMSQFGYANITVNKIGSLIVENIADANITKEESSSGFLFWSSVERSLKSAANAESSSQLQDQRSSETRVFTRDADTSLINRLLEQFLFISKDNASVADVQKVISQHLAAAKKANEQGNQALGTAHNAYANYLRTLTSDATEDNRQSKAQEAFKALQSVLGSTGGQSGTPAANGAGSAAAAGASTGNPWIAAAAFLVNGIAFKDEYNSGSFHMRSLQKTNWNDSDDRRLYAVLNNQVARLFTVSRADFPIMRGANVSLDVEAAEKELTNLSSQLQNKKPQVPPTPTPTPPSSAASPAAQGP